jgi:hypothetical protein
LSGLNKFLSGPSSSTATALTERTASHDSEEDVKSPTTTTTTTLKNASAGTMTTKSLSAVRGLAGSLKRGVSKRIATASSPLKKQKSVPMATPGGGSAGSGIETPANYKMYPTTTNHSPTIETAQHTTTTTTTETKMIASLTEEEKVKDYRKFFQEQLDVVSDTFVPIDINNGEETMGVGILNPMEDELQDAVIDNMKDDCHCAFCTIQ